MQFIEIMDFVTFTVVTGLLLGILYGINAIGIVLIYGIIKIVNLAHGALLMIGAYVTYWLFTLLLLPPTLSLSLTFLFGLALGLFLFNSMFKRLFGAPDMITLTATFGLSIIFQEFARVVWGPTPRGFVWEVGMISVAGFTIPARRLLSALIGLAIAGVFYFVLYRTRFGRAVRAVIQEPGLASLCGVNTMTIYLAAISLAIGVVVASGTLVTMYTPAGIEPYMGELFTVRAFVIAVLAGLTSTIGAFISGIILGLTESMSYMVLSLTHVVPNPFSMTRFIVFALLLLLLLVKPEGLIKR